MVQRNLIRNKDKNVSPICKLFFRIVFFVLHNKKIQKNTKKKKQKKKHT